MTVKEKAKHLVKKFGKTLALECVNEILIVEADWARFIEKKSEYQVHTRQYCMDVKADIK